jgi:hypothetical protein
MSDRQIWDKGVWIEGKRGRILFAAGSGAPSILVGNTVLLGIFGPWKSVGECLANHNLNDIFYWASQIGRWIIDHLDREEVGNAIWSCYCSRVRTYLIPWIRRAWNVGTWACTDITRTARESESHRRVKCHGERAWTHRDNCKVWV